MFVFRSTTVLLCMLSRSYCGTLEHCVHCTRYTRMYYRAPSLLSHKFYLGCLQTCRLVLIPPYCSGTTLSGPLLSGWWVVPCFLFDRYIADFVFSSLLILSLITCNQFVVAGEQRKWWKSIRRMVEKSNYGQLPCVLFIGWKVFCLVFFHIVLKGHLKGHVVWMMLWNLWW